MSNVYLFDTLSGYEGWKTAGVFSSRVKAEMRNRAIVDDTGTVAPIREGDLPSGAMEFGRVGTVVSVFRLNAFGETLYTRVVKVEVNTSLV